MPLNPYTILNCNWEMWVCQSDDALCTIMWLILIYSRKILVCIKVRVQLRAPVVKIPFRLGLADAYQCKRLVKTGSKVSICNKNDTTKFRRPEDADPILLRCLGSHQICILEMYVLTVWIMPTRRTTTPSNSCPSGVLQLPATHYPYVAPSISSWIGQSLNFRLLICCKWGSMKTTWHNVGQISVVPDT